MSHKNNTSVIVKGIIAALLLLCLIDADYGFYQAMRTLVSFGFAYLTYDYYKTGDKTNAIVYLCLLIVFQPLMKIGLGRSIWIVVDVLVAGFLIYQLLKGIQDEKRTTAARNQTNHEPSKPSSKIGLDADSRNINNRL